MPENPTPNPTQTPSQIIVTSGLPTPSPNDMYPTPQVPAVNRTLSEVMGNATLYMDEQMSEQTPAAYGLLLLDVTYRQFNVSDFGCALPLFNQLLASNPSDLVEDQLFSRISVPNEQASAADLAQDTNVLDQITLPALYSNVLALPSDYSTMLQNYTNSGGYMMTHALLATIWLQENNCTVSLPTGFMQSLYNDTAALIGNSSTVTDLQIEAAAMLNQAGQGNLVNSAFLQNIMAA